MGRGCGQDRATCERKQKTNRRDASPLLRLLAEDRENITSVCERAL